MQLETGYNGLPVNFPPSMRTCILEGRWLAGIRCQSCKIPIRPGGSCFNKNENVTGLPFFESAERAMKTYAMVRGYQLWREKGLG